MTTTLRIDILACSNDEGNKPNDNFTKASNLHGLGGYVFHWEDQAEECQSCILHFLVLLFLYNKGKAFKFSIRMY